MATEVRPSASYSLTIRTETGNTPGTRFRCRGLGSQAKGAADRGSGA
jgi:hypothetical protein